ncbi:hypothetical protein TPY_0965 [Sulfobacillus acidophilus TPY]|nr:hypothetical protein TPY_0965 [Sulfobacillus acidophilus TPY]
MPNPREPGTGNFVTRTGRIAQWFDVNGQDTRKQRMDHGAE